MMSPESFRQIVSGARRGPVAAFFRTVLGIAELPYSWEVRRRNRRYDSGQEEISQVEVPVISVGNLTMGGTGKTPMVAWMARWFRQHGVRVSLVSRGYGVKSGEVNDEARELQWRLPDVPHVQNRDRVAAARVAIDELETQLIILDDGFQHRRLARDFDVVLVDATVPFGYGHVFPRGMLREPRESLARADWVVMTRTNLVSTQELFRLRDEIRRLAPRAGLSEVAQLPGKLLRASGEEHPREMLRDGHVLAFCGIGNPQGFEQMLATLPWQVIDFRAYPDHFAYDEAAVRDLVAWAEQHADADAIVCTHKDLVKLTADRLAGLPLYALTLDLQFSAGLDTLETKLRAIVDQANARA